MPTYTKLPFSGATSGQPIAITATSGTGTTIHTTGTSSSDIDEIWLYANNIGATSTVTVTLQYGATASGSQIQFGVPAKSGLTLVLPGTILSGDGSSGRVLQAFADTTNVINVVGYVNRIS
jgi:hypothetical protein